MINTRITRLLAFVITTGMFSSCGTKMDLPTVDDAAWLKSVHQAWEEQDEEFKNSPISPLAGASRFEIAAGETIHFEEKNGKLTWSKGEEANPKFSVRAEDGKWRLENIEEEAKCERGGEYVLAGSLLTDGDLFSVGRFSVDVYPLPDLLVALVFDSESPLLTKFTALERYEANRRFSVEARIVKFENPESVELKTARNRIKKRYKYATLEFEIEGSKYELAAFKYSLDDEVPEPLFVPFTDKTTGRESYGGGRYLTVYEPEYGDRVILDFNLATNPLCNYTPIYNCIVPPRENKLDIEILAGEKKYH